MKCVICGAEMKGRTNKVNGNKFYGCSRYPDCHPTASINIEEKRGYNPHSHEKWILYKL